MIHKGGGGALIYKGVGYIIGFDTLMGVGIERGVVR